MGQHGQPVAYFDMHMRRGVPLQQVHEMLREVVRRVGRSRCGTIDITEPCDHGRYLIAFDSREAADTFEQLYRSTGHNPHRSADVPSGMTVIETEVRVVGGILIDVGDLMRRMNAHLN